MKTVIAVFLAPLLLGCAGVAAVGDGVKIVWHKAETYEQVTRMCHDGHGLSLKQKFPANAIGCYYETPGACHIVAKDCSTNECFAVIGHELKHCFDGRFHDPHGKIDKRYFTGE